MLVLVFSGVEIGLLIYLLFNISEVSKNNRVEDYIMVLSVVAPILNPFIWSVVAASVNLWYEGLIIPTQIVFYLKKINEKLEKNQ